MKVKILCFMQIAMLALMTAFFFGCTLSSPPIISVSAETVVISAVTNKTTWDEEQDPEQEVFETILDSYAPSELPFVAVDEEITIKFYSGLPDSIKLNEYLIYIDEQGDIATQDPKALMYSYNRKNAFFTIEPIEEVPIFSEVLRGYKMECRFSGGNECEYSFIIRSAQIYNLPDFTPIADPNSSSATFIKYTENYIQDRNTAPNFLILNEHDDLIAFKTELEKREPSDNEQDDTEKPNKPNKENDEIDGTAHLLTYLNQFDRAYFDKNTLIIFVSVEETRSLSYNVDEISVNSGVLTLTLNRLIPQKIEDIPSFWLTFITISKSDANIESALLIINNPHIEIEESINNPMRNS